MADVLALDPAEKDIVKVVAAIRALQERFMPSEDVAASAAQSATQIIAGAGLTGGGDLSENRTLNVGAGTGITVNANDVAISADGVTNTLLANMAEATFKMRAAGAGTGDPIDGTSTQARTAADAEQIGVATGINTQTGSYTLVLADKGKIVEQNVGSANDLTVPPNSSVAFPTGTYVNVTQLGAGQTTLVPGSGVTIRSANSALKLGAQYAVATLYKRGTDEWVAGGNLVP